MQKLGSNKPILSRDRVEMSRSTANCPTFAVETMGWGKQSGSRFVYSQHDESTNNDKSLA
jgi:hypothetical protein